METNPVPRPQSTNVMSALLMSTPTNIAVLGIICALLITAGTHPDRHPGYEAVYMASLLINAAFVIGWLVYATIIMARSRMLSPMRGPMRRMFNWLEGVLFLFWVVCWFITGLTGPWMIYLGVICFVVPIFLLANYKENK